jgi:hypothetical protein
MDEQDEVARIDIFVGWIHDSAPEWPVERCSIKKEQ